MFDPLRVLADLWVRLAQGLAMSRGDIEGMNRSLASSRVLMDLERKQSYLCSLESKMEREIDAFVSCAREKKAKGDISGARQKLLEKRSLVSQLERLRSSQGIIAMHLGAMKGAELNQTLISTLKASNTAIRSMVPEHEVSQIEDFMYDLEDEVKRTTQIGDVLAKPISTSSDLSSSGALAGTSNAELERELEELLLSDSDGPRATAPLLSTVPIPLPVVGGIPPAARDRRPRGTQLSRPPTAEEMSYAPAAAARRAALQVPA